MDEHKFLEEGDMLVTSSRIVLAGKTFATRNVGSVEIQAGEPGAFPVVLGLVGIVLLFNQAWIWAMLFFAAAVGLGILRSKKRTIKLMAGGGEQVAYETTNDVLAERLKAAIAQAISVR